MSLGSDGTVPQGGVVRPSVPPTTVTLTRWALTAGAVNWGTSPADGDVVMVIPAFNEAEGIGSVIDDVRRDFTSNILVVAYPSTDGTEQEAERHGANVIHQTGRGKGDAVRSALAYISEHYPSVRLVGMIDADCTYPTSQLGLMRSVLLSHPSIGMVVGARANLRNNGLRSVSYAIGNRTIARMHSWFNRVSMQDPLSGLRLIRVEALRSWTPQSMGFDIECELNNHVLNDAQLEVAEVPIEYRPRVGVKKLGTIHGFRILARIIQLRFQAPRAVSE